MSSRHHCVHRLCTIWLLTLRLVGLHTRLWRAPGDALLGWGLKRCHWLRERTEMTPAKVSRSGATRFLVSFKSVRPEKSPSNCGWVTLLCWEIRSLIGCNVAHGEEKVIPAVPVMRCLGGAVQNKIKEKKKSFCFRQCRYHQRAMEIK